MNRIATILAFALALALAAAAEDKKDDANAKDLKTMQGDWAGDSFTRDGMAFPPDDAQALFRTVKGDRYTLSRFRKKVGSGKFTIDATKSPREITFYPDAPPKGKPAPAMPGIYKIEGDRITMCYPAPGGKRPTKFEAPEGSGLSLVVWVREKKE
jgi:uncharacterized protein (TIGR03067 family)